MTAPLSDAQRDRLAEAIRRGALGPVVAEMLAEARAEGAAEVVERVEDAFAFVAEIVGGFDTEVFIRAAINLIRDHAALADPEADQ